MGKILWRVFLFAMVVLVLVVGVSAFKADRSLSASEKILDVKCVQQECVAQIFFTGHEILEDGDAIAQFNERGELVIRYATSDPDGDGTVDHVEDHVYTSAQDIVTKRFLPICRVTSVRLVDGFDRTIDVIAITDIGSCGNGSSLSRS